MRAGGTCDLPALNEDLSQVNDGNYATSNLIQLPLDPNFSSANVVTPGLGLGLRPDLQTPNTGANPIIGQTPVTRFNLQQPANGIQLLWEALDQNGNYQCSYPLNSLSNIQGTGVSTLAGIQYSGGEIGTTGDTRWAKGWIRLNGQGLWFPMSLLPATETMAPPTVVTGTTGTGSPNYSMAQSMVNPRTGFSSIIGPISFFDWIGFWDGVGDITDGPNGANAFILAALYVNMGLGSNGGSLGAVPNYAIPNSSGRQVAQNQANAQQRTSDILVPPGGAGSAGCDD